jgi:hypothetical protein
LSVSNADKADSGKAEIKLETGAVSVAEEIVTGSKTWVALDLAPAHYRITVRAIVGGKPVSAMGGVIVKPGEIAPVQISLPV